MAESNKFFFRTETLNNDPDAYTSVPEDMEWAINEGAKKPLRRGEGGSGGQGSMDAPGPHDGSGTFGEGSTGIQYPNTKIDTPVIKGIFMQEVSQDPEGKGTIDVTFNVQDLTQTAVEWEIRLTR